MRWLGKTGFPPLEIRSRGLNGGDVFVDASESSQFLSGILIAAPGARGGGRGGMVRARRILALRGNNPGNDERGGNPL